MENKMKEVAKLLGVKIGEKFNILDGAGGPFYINEKDGLKDCYNSCRQCMLTDLLLGVYIIERPPFKPKYRDEYYTVDINGHIYREIWCCISNDYYRYNANNCFKTSEEITEKDILRIVRELKEPYDNK